MLIHGLRIARSPPFVNGRLWHFCEKSSGKLPQSLPARLWRIALCLPRGRLAGLACFARPLWRCRPILGTLFKDYRPLKFFSLIALAFCIGGLCAGIPVVSEYLATGLVPRLPTAILAVAFMFIAALSLATGFILDAVAKVERKQWGLRVYRQAENE